MLSAEQLAQRLEGITATDAAAIMGVHPHRTAIDVWNEKLGLAPPFEGNARTKWGNILERPIREDYEERHGCRVEVPGTLVHHEHPWRMATPDGLVYFAASEPDRGLEIKVHGDEAIRFGKAVYGEPGTDEVPPWELIQCMWNVDVAHVNRWDLVAFYDGVPMEYTIDRDDELIGMLAESGEKFLVDHVRTKQPPPPDGTDRYTAWLKSRWKENGEAFVDIAESPEILADVKALRVNRELAASVEIEVSRLEQRLKLVIGENAGAIWNPERKNSKPGSHRITWKRNKDSSYTDWVGVMSDMRREAALVASGRSVELDTIEVALKRIGGGYVGETTLSGVDLLAVFKLARETLTNIAKAATEINHRHTKTGNRPFLVPRNWKSTTEAQEQ